MDHRPLSGPPRQDRRKAKLKRPAFDPAHGNRAFGDLVPHHQLPFLVRIVDSYGRIDFAGEAILFIVESGMPETQEALAGAGFDVVAGDVEGVMCGPHIGSYYPRRRRRIRHRW